MCRSSRWVTLFINVEHYAREKHKSQQQHNTHNLTSSSFSVVGETVAVVANHTSQHVVTRSSMSAISEHSHESSHSSMSNSQIMPLYDVVLIDDNMPNMSGMCCVIVCVMFVYVCRCIDFIEH